MIVLDLLKYLLVNKIIKVMENEILKMMVAGMKQKLIFSDMLELQKIARAVNLATKAHYEAKMASEELELIKVNLIEALNSKNFEKIQWQIKRIDKLLKSLINDKDDTQRNS